MSWPRRRAFAGRVRLHDVQAPIFSSAAWSRTSATTHQNFDRVRGLRRIDLSRDPPPDLAVEVDITHSSLDRMGIYERLGIPELWRLEGELIRVYLLNADGRYEPADAVRRSTVIAVFELAPFASDRLYGRQCEHGSSGTVVGSEQLGRE